MNELTLLKETIENYNLWDKEISASRNEYLKVKGSIDTNLYFIEGGCVRIFVVEESKEQTIRFGYNQDIITALDSFISEKPSDLYIQALLNF